MVNYETTENSLFQYWLKKGSLHGHVLVVVDNQL